MLDFWELTASSACLAFGLWKTGFSDLIIEKLSTKARDTYAWVTSPEGACRLLAEDLPYQDFFQDVILTENGYLWTGVEVKTIATDSISGSDWEALGERISRIYSTLPEKTFIQVVFTVNHTSDLPAYIFKQVLKRAASSPSAALAPLAYSRARYFKQQADAGKIRSIRTFVFLGRQKPSKMTDIPISAIWSAKPFMDIQHEEFLEIYQEIIRVRDNFISVYQDVGGQNSAAPISARTAYDLIYRRLNPARAKLHPSPNLTINLPWQTTKKMSVDGIELSSTHEELFANNPRETLCFTNAEIQDYWINFEGVLASTISLKKLPTRVYAGLMERFTRSREIDFDYETVTSFEARSYQDVDEELERKLNWAMKNITRAGNNPNADEKAKADDLIQIRDRIRKGEERIGNVGLQIFFTANNKADLRYRADKILALLRRLEGLEGAVESDVAFESFVGALPCAPMKDPRRKLTVSSVAASLTPFTGSPTGVSPREAIDIFETPDQKEFFWNPRSETFDSAMTLFCGPPGSGKSVALNRQRSTMLMSGRLGVTLDFDRSAMRLCKAVGGRYINIGDPLETQGLGLFAIRPQPGETFKPGELTPEGLPKDRLEDLFDKVELLCLDPNRESEISLEPVQVTILRKYITLTYANLVDMTPTLDDVINSLYSAYPLDLDIARDLAARLEIYASNNSLGNFLNDAADPLSVDIPYTVFDFKGATDNPKLMLVATMAVQNYVSRFIRANPTIEKFVDVDEFYVITDYKKICKLIALIVRTARKKSTVVSVASQSPDDFDKNDIVRGIKSSCEVKWLLRSNDPTTTARVFELSPGELAALRRLEVGGEDFRDCLLIYPSTGTRGGCAHLRLRFSPTDKRILMSAGRERASVTEALADLKGFGQLNDTFYQALKG